MDRTSQSCDAIFAPRTLFSSVSFLIVRTDAALLLNKKHMGPRYIEIFRAIAMEAAAPYLAMCLLLG